MLITKAAARVAALALVGVGAGIGLVGGGAGVGGCMGSAYTPGFLIEGPGGTYENGRRVGNCLEFAVWHLPSREIGARALVAFAFGNRCDDGQPLDLRAVRVRARCGAHEGVELSPYDPRHELKAGRLAPWGAGSERIAYGSPSCDAEPRDVCVDLGAVTSGGRRGPSGVLDANAKNDATTICLPDDAAPPAGGAAP